MEKVANYLDSGKPVDVIYLDFQKAFDKVPHMRLLARHEEIGITGKLLDWIREWLKGKKQRAVINGKASQWIEVDSGVPWSSILRPLLFIIFINGIDEGIVGDILIFADDTKLVGKVGSSRPQRTKRSLWIIYIVVVRIFFLPQLTLRILLARGSASISDGVGDRVHRTVETVGRASAGGRAVVLSNISLQYSSFESSRPILGEHHWRCQGSDGVHRQSGELMSYCYWIILSFLLTYLKKYKPAWGDILQLLTYEDE